MSAITTIPNLGPASEEAFRRAGLTTAEEIRALGPDEAYRRLLAQGNAVQVRRRPASRETAGDRIVHNDDGTFTFHGKRYDSLDDAARALLDEGSR